MTATYSENEFDDRVTIHDKKTGKTSRVLAKDVTGLDDWVKNWETIVDDPQPISFSGWQMVDDEHPIGGGQSAYRIVLKTVRMIVFPDTEFADGSVLVRFKNGVVTWGEPRYKNALPARRLGVFLLPEWGEVKAEENYPEYKPNLDRTVHMEGHQDSTPPTNYVEIICRTELEEDALFEQRMAAGRAASAPVLTLFELMFGARLLGPTLTEEVGEVFADGHWNRLLGGRVIHLEMQADPRVIGGRAFRARIQHALTGIGKLDEPTLRRVTTGAEWFWTAEALADPVQRFVSYWLAIEALLLKENANIKPIKKAVAEILSCDAGVISQPIGRLYQLRNKLAHGEHRNASDESVRAVQVLATCVLELKLFGFIKIERCISLAKHLGVSYEPYE